MMQFRPLYSYRMPGLLPAGQKTNNIVCYFISGRQFLPFEGIALRGNVETFPPVHGRLAN
jgi:hypothetical protein